MTQSATSLTSSIPPSTRPHSRACSAPINPAGGPDLFGLAVYGDPGDPDRNIAHLEQAGLCLPDEAYYREDHYAPVREAYVAMVATQLVNAGYAPAAESNGGDELPSNTGDDESNAPATVPSEAALGMARHFLAVETKIAANHWDNVATRDSVKTYNPTDYADLAATLKNFDLGSWNSTLGRPLMTPPKPPRLSRLISSLCSRASLCTSRASSLVLMRSGPRAESGRP